MKEVASYVLSLSGRKVDMVEAKKGEARFTICAACHGPDAKGGIAFERQTSPTTPGSTAVPVRWSSKPSPTVATA